MMLHNIWAICFPASHISVAQSLLIMYCKLRMCHLQIIRELMCKMFLCCVYKRQLKQTLWLDGLWKYNNFTVLMLTSCVHCHVPLESYYPRAVMFLSLILWFILTHSQVKSQLLIESEISGSGKVCILFFQHLFLSFCFYFSMM